MNLRPAEKNARSSAKKLAFAEEKVEEEKACIVEKSLEIEQLKHDLRLFDDQKRISEDALKSKLETLSLDHRNACEEVDKLRVDLGALRKERDDLAVKVKEFGQTSVPMDDIQKLRNQLLEITKERDEVVAQAEKLHNHKVEQQLLIEKFNEKLLNDKAEVEELMVKLSAPEVTRHNISSLLLKYNGRGKKLLRESKTEDEAEWSADKA